MTQDTRKDPRAKVLTMTVRYKSATLDEFIEHHSYDVSRGGMFIKTPSPFPPGTLLKFEVKIAGEQRVMQGVGRVVWKREVSEVSEARPAGMGVKFIKIDDDSRKIIDQLVTARGESESAFDQEGAVAKRSPGAAAGVVPLPAQAGGSAHVPRKATMMGLGAMQAGRESPEAAAAEAFFPPTSPAMDMPPPEDRTVMRQAAELLQDALRGAGGSLDEVGTPSHAVGAQKPKLEAESSKAESSKAEAPKAESSKAESSKAESSKAESSKAESSKAESSKAESSKAESSKAESSKAEASKAEASKAEASKAEASKAEASKAEASKAEASKAEASKVEPPKAEAPGSKGQPEKSVIVTSPGDEVTKPAARKSEVVGDSLKEGKPRASVPPQVHARGSDPARARTSDAPKARSAALQEAAGVAAESGGSGRLVLALIGMIAAVGVVYFLTQPDVTAPTAPEIEPVAEQEPVLPPEPDPAPEATEETPDPSASVTPSQAAAAEPAPVIPPTPPQVVAPKPAKPVAKPRAAVSKPPARPAPTEPTSSAPAASTQPEPASPPSESPAPQAPPPAPKSPPAPSKPAVPPAAGDNPY